MPPSKPSQEPPSEPFGEGHVSRKPSESSSEPPLRNPSEYDTCPKTQPESLLRNVPFSKPLSDPPSERATCPRVHRELRLSPEDPECQSRKPPRKPPSAPQPSRKLPTAPRSLRVRHLSPSTHLQRT